MKPEKVFAIIDSKQEKFIQQLKQLVQIYPKGEEILQRKVESSLESVGCEVEFLKLHSTQVQLHKEFAVEEAIDMTKRIHVIGKIPGSGDGKSLMLITHPDADPINPDDWSQPLHEGVVENGKMYGWAVADDLAGICIMTGAVEALNKAGYKPKGDLYLMCASAK
ncbi:MAG: M20/M25/M40 family metallo-hydrolase [Candidatus Bathyarchaeota archaeon]|nr:M20/M25/M40 family metallo-hydrolase [Candidatus Bathyarchaeota archaeon]